MLPSSLVPTNLAPQTPKLKGIHCRLFDGKEVYSDLGATFEDIPNEFDGSVRVEQFFNRSIWSRELETSVLRALLEGAASHVYFDFIRDRAVSYN
eukprot:jgi/Phyca11/104957/e_gw1.10.549.1